MAREVAGRRSSIWPKIVAVVFVVVVFIAAAAVLVPQFLLNQATDVAVIKGSSEPFKVKPKDSGGMKIPHQDTTVMSMIGQLLPADEAVEILRPPSAVPEMAPTSDGEMAVNTADDSSEAAEVASDPEPVVGDLAAAPEQVADAEDTPDTTSGENTPKGEDNSVDEDGPGEPTTKTAQQAPAGTPDDASRNAAGGEDVAIPEMQVPLSKPDRMEATKERLNSNEPLYIVQLAAFREASKAVEQAGLLSKKHESRLAEVTLGTMKVDTGENGIFWRVVTEPLLRSEADALCTGLKRAGQDCILRKFNKVNR
ncbi:SPOR domain-containing protein [Alphaproteobacteria bacterium]|nr:SPOR domain-containing protein [Alphaproteobacteria bacterium]